MRTASYRILGFGGPADVPPLVVGDKRLETGERELSIQRIGSHDVLAQFVLGADAVSGLLTNGVSDDGKWFALQGGLFIDLEKFSLTDVQDAVSISSQFIHWVRGRAIGAYLDAENDELLLVEPGKQEVLRHKLHQQVLSDGISVAPSLRQVAIFSNDGHTLVVQQLCAADSRIIALSRRAEPRQYGICPVWLDERRIAYLGRKHSVLVLDTITEKISLVSSPFDIVGCLSYAFALEGPIGATQVNRKSYLHAFCSP